MDDDFVITMTRLVSMMQENLERKYWASANEPSQNSGQESSSSSTTKQNKQNKKK